MPHLDVAVGVAVEKQLLLETFKHSNIQTVQVVRSFQTSETFQRYDPDTNRYSIIQVYSNQFKYSKVQTLMLAGR